MKPLTWRSEVIIRILTLIGLIVSDDEAISKELTALRNHITYGPREK